MIHYETKNGWTKERMKTAINTGNNGTRSFERHNCVYRADNGNKCAVGCFIPDEVYIPEMDIDQGSGTGADAIIHGFDLHHYMPLNNHGMGEMQIIHDNVDDGADIRIKLCNWIDANVEESEQE